MGDYVVQSLETHLFFARIMKEHGLFLEAGFPCAEGNWIQRADRFRAEFENLLREVVRLSEGRVGKEILCSGEVVTEFTFSAERRTEQLAGVPIDSRITRQQENIQSGCADGEDRRLTMIVNQINQRAISLLEEFIAFKESILEEVKNGRLFNGNYPLLVEHILREARLYCLTVKQLLNGEELSFLNLCETEKFWNQIMMEHAFFIRGLLDPTEGDLINTANNFAGDFKELLESARRQDCRAAGLTEETLRTTLKYRDFKAAGAEGILECKIASVILPLLADHVLREANHYIRLLESVVK